SIYAQRLIDKINTNEVKKQIKDAAIVFSENATSVWNHELPDYDIENLPFKVYNINDYNAPFASGSANYDAMVICPCSMGTVGRIAHGISNNLITRAADVMLKERRKLIIVPRESPFNSIHINNLKILSDAGAIILPAMPSFYSKPQSINELIDTVVYRILDLIPLQTKHYKWQEN
ncbi:MAG: 3-octaprenyl-4-hydroxybenzoate carboxy-lyase, partial [Draconibacterium sp.]